MRIASSLGLLFALIVSACAADASPAGLAVQSTGPSASPVCVAPGGHATALATSHTGRASLQVTFVQPCDLSVRVSAVSFGIFYEGISGVTAARIRSAALSTVLVIYNAASDGPQTRTFHASVLSWPGGSLDELHEAICRGHATFELGFRGTRSIDAPVLPSNTGKC